MSGGTANTYGSEDSIVQAWPRSALGWHRRIEPERRSRKTCCWPNFTDDEQEDEKSRRYTFMAKSLMDKIEGLRAEIANSSRWLQGLPDEAGTVCRAELEKCLGLLSSISLEQDDGADEP